MEKAEIAIEKTHICHPHKSSVVKKRQKEAACGNLCGIFFFYTYARNNALNKTSSALAAHLSKYYIFFPSLTNMSVCHL